MFYLNLILIINFTSCIQDFCGADYYINQLDLERHISCLHKNLTLSEQKTVDQLMLVQEPDIDLDEYITIKWSKSSIDQLNGKDEMES